MINIGDRHLIPDWPEDEYRESDYYEPCGWDKQHYDPSEMVYDEEGCCYIHKKNVLPFLENLVGNLTKEEHRDYSEKLLKQL